MSERGLMEKRLSLPQTLARLEGATRELRQRAFRGAVRTVMSDSVAGATPGTMSQMLSLTVSAGRWSAIAEGTFAKATSVGNEEFHMTFGAFDQSTGEQLTLEEENYPLRKWKVSHTGGASLYAPMSLCGDFISDQRQIVFAVLACDVSIDATAFILQSACLTLYPW